MNPTWTKIIIETTLKHKIKNLGDESRYSSYELAKGMREFKITIIRLIKDFALITFGIFSAAFGFKGFLLTNHFIDGSATGISLLISNLTSIPLFL
jgi:hypothetical protein